MRALSAIVLIAATLAGCGGSGEESTLPQDGGAVSLLSASYDSDGTRAASMIIFEGGLVYLFYQSPIPQFGSPPYAYAGFFRGVTRDSGTMRRYQGVHFDFEAGVERDAHLALTFDGNGTTAGGPLIHDEASDSVERSVYAIRSSVSTMPTAAARVGSYVGYARSATRSVSEWNGSVDVSGQLALAATGCRVAGRVAPRPVGNIQVAIVSMEGIACPGRPGTYTGHGLRSFSTDQLFMFLTDDSGHQGILYQLGEPD